MNGLVVGTEKGKLIIFRSVVCPLSRSKPIKEDTEWLVCEQTRKGLSPTPFAQSNTMRSTVFDRSFACSIVSASAYTRTTFSVPEGLPLTLSLHHDLTNERPFGIFATIWLISGWIVSGATHCVSSSLHLMIVRSSTFTTVLMLQSHSPPSPTRAGSRTGD